MGPKVPWRTLAAILGVGGLLASAEAMAQAAGAPGADTGGLTQRIGLAAAAAIAISASVAGSAYAVARIGSAAIGAAAERPELLNRTLVFVALAEGLAVLGFVIAMMLVQRI